MSQSTTRGRKLAVLGMVAALAAVTVIPTAVGAQDEMADEMAKVRVLHGAGDAPAVDVYAGGNLIVEGLEYAKITDYLEVRAASPSTRAPSSSTRPSPSMPAP
jgi:hypothetical protein